MKLRFLCAFFCVATVFLCSCGSASKVVRDVVITSDPPGATVYLDGDKVGVTPLKVQTFFTWNKDDLYNSLFRRIIQVKKEGYESQSRDLYPVDMPNLQFLLNRENIAVKVGAQKVETEKVIGEKIGTNKVGSEEVGGNKNEAHY